jgi:DNA-binding transcriptional MocR family regulator
MVCFEDAILGLLGLDLSIYEKMVYIVLRAHTEKDGLCYPSAKRIALEANCSRSKVFEALKTLEERGLILRPSRIYEDRPGLQPVRDHQHLPPAECAEETGMERAEQMGRKTQSMLWTGGVRKLGAIEQDRIREC